MSASATIGVMVRVDVWHVRTDALDRATGDACMRLLTDDERAKHERFVFEKNRHEYLVTRGLERAVLARYLERPAAELSFGRTEHGRPVLETAPRDGSRRIVFNLTNTVELVACGVTEGPEIGIDAEPLARADQILGIAETVFTAHERADLERLPLGPRRRRAVELWTSKEAYMKARGLGFFLPVKGFELVFDELGGPPALRLHPEVEDDSERWALTIHEVEGHLIATCVERTRDGAVEVALHRADLGVLL